MDIHHDLQTPREGQPEPDDTREKAELLDWLLSTEDFAFELCLALKGEFDSINGTPRDQALAALRAAKAGEK